LNKLNITIFSGGSGNQELIKVISKMSWINTNIITNCYDDGKSTGRLRVIVKNMLGPSDLRKNVFNMLEPRNYENKLLKRILEFRVSNISFYKMHKEFLSNKGAISELLATLPKSKYSIIEKYVKIFLKKFSKFKIIEKDVAFGNIIFAGIFLKYNNFNYASEIFNKIFLGKEVVLNVTNGENLYLKAIRENGDITYEEGSLVINSGSRIKDIFLVKKKFDLRQRKKINQLDYNSKYNFLKKKNIYPKINEKLKKILRNSDLIIFGPGTQFSSLYPSYLTQDICNSIQQSKAVKIFVSNIFYDFDIVNQDINYLINNFFYFMSNRNKITIKKDKLINYYFINNFDDQDINNSNKKDYISPGKILKSSKFQFLDWEKKAGIHYPGLLLKKFINVSKKKYLTNILSQSFFTVSIIIPCLNENKTILKTLTKVNELNLDKYNLTKEIIVVDGGSNDGTFEKIKRYKYCKFYRTDRPGKGEAIKKGIEKAKGDIIAFYPADEEYNILDLETAIKLITVNNNDIIYGSRNIKMLNLSGSIKKIYNNNIIAYFISKYGGMLLSIMCLLFYNRYVSDSLTSIKVFKSEIIKKFDLKCSNFDIDLEITTKILKSNYSILEIPVSYKARSRADGKKIKLSDGIKCIKVIIKNLFIKC
jgi:glycosyltransferase involved in cell wall biosynthesis